MRASFRSLFFPVIHSIPCCSFEYRGFSFAGSHFRAGKVLGVERTMERFPGVPLHITPPTPAGRAAGIKPVFWARLRRDARNELHRNWKHAKKPTNSRMSAVFPCHINRNVHGNRSFSRSLASLEFTPDCYCSSLMLSDRRDRRHLLRISPGVILYLAALRPVAHGCLSLLLGKPRKLPPRPPTGQFSPLFFLSF